MRRDIVSPRTHEGRPGPLPIRTFRVIFTVLLVAGILFGWLAVERLRIVKSDIEGLTSGHAEDLLLAERLNTFSERIGLKGRSYLLTGQPRFLSEMEAAQQAFQETLEKAGTRTRSEDELALLMKVRSAADDHEKKLNGAVYSQSEGREQTAKASEEAERELQPVRDALDATLSELTRVERKNYEEAKERAFGRAQTSLRLLAVAALGGTILALVLALILAKVLKSLQQSRKALEDALARLERKNEDLDAFAGRIAHDLRNILSPLSLSAGRLRTKGVAPEIVRSSADSLLNTSRRAHALIDGLLAFSRGGRSPDGQVRASVRAAVEEAMEDLEPLRLKSAAEWRCDIEDSTVTFDPSLLHTTLVNVIGNALKFVEGRPVRIVSLSARHEQQDCVLTVSDTGPGISKEALPHIFEAFYRAPDASAGGSGIGLATVERIVSGHGGSVSADSSPGEGTRISLRLPLH
jgi:signal transduction histidine kinase